jgi:general secretion pathway protein C
MVKTPSSASLVAGLLWLLAALSAGYWVLQILGRSALEPVPAAGRQPIQAEAAAVARALGAVPDAAPQAAVAPPLSSRFRLIGLAAQPGQRGAALIAVDGQPPRPVLVGAVVDGDLRLLSVGRRVARIGKDAADPAALDINLPDPPE